MKITCDCGNETLFNTIDEKTGEQTRYDESDGQYARYDISKFAFWQSHDVVGIYCEACKKGIWLFT